MITRKRVSTVLDKLSSNELRAAELLTGCYECRLFNECENGHRFFQKPRSVAEFLDSHSPQSEQSQP